MSRTDRHRPWRVQEADPYEKRKITWYQQPRWPDQTVFLYRDCNCRNWGCWLGGIYRLQRRRERHQAQRLAREAVKGGTCE